MTTVIVTNIAPGTSESTITEFFGFCGRIVNIRLEDGENSMTAHITFETANAANTSLLLANAMIADRAIQVAMDPNAPAAPASTSTQGEFPAYPASEDGANAGESLTGGATRAEPNAATSTIAKLLAAGHKLSDTAAAEARALDDRWQVTNKVNAGLDEVKGDITGFSERIGLTKNPQAAYQAVSTKATETGIPDAATQAANATEGFFSNLARQASATIQSVAQSGAQWAETNMPTAVAKLREAGTAVGQQAEAIRVEAHQIYPGATDAETAQDASMVPDEPAGTTFDSPAAAHASPVPAPAATTITTANTGTPSIL